MEYSFVSAFRVTDAAIGVADGVVSCASWKPSQAGDALV